ncbi:MAG: glutathione S-transferase family protein [Pseudomonadota bacterium]
MGLLVDGKWQDTWYETKNSGGRFVRKDSSFRNTVTADGSSGHPAEAGRYHLYVSYACPWAHRTLIFRKLKGLENAISVSVVNPLMRENGWTFAPYPGSSPDPINNADFAYQIYQAAKPDYTGRVTVPILWDKEKKTIVNNESSEIIRMFNSEFDAIATKDLPDMYPAPLREEIDAVNTDVYGNVNNGVYRCGFATTTEAYEEAFDSLFAALDRLEERLSKGRYLVGDRLTEADWRLVVTLWRFDPVYVGHFKCNRNRIFDYPNLWNYTKDLYQTPGVAETVNLDHIKTHYYASHETINPTLIVPKGPNLDYATPHDRDRFAVAA